MKKIKKYKMISILIFITLITFIFSLKNKTSENLKIETSNTKQNNLVSIKLQNDTNGYDNSNSVPTSGYQLNTTLSICKVGETKQDVTITYENGKINISNLTTNKTKCEIYFDKFTSKDLILSKNTIDTSRSSGYFTSAFATNTAGKIFSAEDDDGTTYFFAGSIPNNWVQFGGYYWRIIRVNGDGSIRIIYNGTTSGQTGETTQIGISAFETSHNDNAYVGYMTGKPNSSSYEETHRNINSSTIKNYLDNWYSTNLKTNYEKFIDTNAGFCGDRTVDNYSDGYTGDGHVASKTEYAPRKRLENTYTAIYNCSKSNDLYTVKNSKKGNQALTNPIGLVTTDEVMYAGGYKYASGATYNHWLKTGQDYWTMSPSLFNSGAYIYAVNNTGSVQHYSNYSTTGVRPVINLKADTLTTGSGTTSDPYRVS